MSLIKYDCSWVGIDGGREGLWKEPLWTDVLRIIAEHDGERVYDQDSPIYKCLEKAYPNESWRSQTAEGHFRPLFRDYPNSWTRTGVVTLTDQHFRLTKLGRDAVTAKISKSELLVDMFKMHVENSGPGGQKERPFAVIAAAFLETHRPIATSEVYWAIMKNYRSSQDSLSEILKKKIPLIRLVPEATPYRRLRSMLTLMRAADVVASARRASGTYWHVLNPLLLEQIAKCQTP